MPKMGMFFYSVLAANIYFGIYAYENGGGFLCLISLAVVSYLTFEWIARRYRAYGEKEQEKA